MFASRYFADRYFAPRYFPKVGAEPEPAAPSTYTVNWLSPSMRLSLILFVLLRLKDGS